MDFYSEEIENIIENLGASNESEIYTGLLIEKSAFRKKNHIESFFVLSQINLITLYKKVLRLYKEKFFDFELKTELLGCYTYTICYYYAGCFLKDEEIRKFLEKYKRKRLFIGLPWLIFSDVFFELQKKLKAEK